MEDIIIQIFDNQILAELAQIKLETSGIKSALDNFGKSRAGGSGGRTAIRVLEKDVQKAKELLNIN